jgi:hypothetical protein
VSRHAAAILSPTLCYDDRMEPSASHRVAKRAAQPRQSRTKKHFATAATAEQISRGVGVTKKDKALVRKVLVQLGYIREEAPEETKPARISKIRSRKG